MRTVAFLLVDLIVVIAKLLGPGGVKGLLAETLLLRHQLMVLNRPRRRAPRLIVMDRFVMGLTALFVRPARLIRNAVVVRPSTLLRFHDALKKRKYRRLFSSHGSNRKPGPRGPSQDIIDAIVQMKQRNPTYGCPRIAQQLSKAFGIELDKDVVRRVLAKHYRHAPGGGGPSWLTFLGHMKDSLWSVDLFRCESILLRTHW